MVKKSHKNRGLVSKIAVPILGVASILSSCKKEPIVVPNPSFSLNTSSTIMYEDAARAGIGQNNVIVNFNGEGSYEVVDENGDKISPVNNKIDINSLGDGFIKVSAYNSEGGLVNSEKLKTNENQAPILNDGVNLLLQKPFTDSDVQNLKQYFTDVEGDNFSINYDGEKIVVNDKYNASNKYDVNVLDKVNQAPVLNSLDKDNFYKNLDGSFISDYLGLNYSDADGDQLTEIFEYNENGTWKEISNFDRNGQYRVFVNDGIEDSEKRNFNLKQANITKVLGGLELELNGEVVKRDIGTTDFYIETDTEFDKVEWYKGGELVYTGNSFGDYHTVTGESFDSYEVFGIKDGRKVAKLGFKVDKDDMIEVVDNGTFIEGESGYSVVSKRELSEILLPKFEDQEDGVDLLKCTIVEYYNNNQGTEIPNPITNIFNVPIDKTDLTFDDLENYLNKSRGYKLTIDAYSKSGEVSSQTYKVFTESEY